MELRLDWDNDLCQALKLRSLESKEIAISLVFTGHAIKDDIAKEKL